MDEKDFFEAVYRVINKYNQKTKQPRQYPTGQLLYGSEVHTMTVIGGRGRVTAKQLAALQGITKGAVSQMTQKLLQKGLIQKEPSPAGRGEVFLSLTAAGKTVYDSHLAFHENLLAELAVLVRELPQESRETLEKMLCVVEHALDQYE
ncbi:MULTISPECIES: MarR family winged helix-turn-helix transcriptional regulator [Caproicibacterium]|uniref:MarR family winged helix-turn-helix transcriptional regulator n=1 Tax=Caproicibacterium argilliputei TaxID=3030016 RepID=A0AA97D976_9FIRM|nr:MarR family winged helix-turn-helix transcriptional regulator [Caproicibacterium argilliputei]WOC32561.1 MarR family winged helix-turn-helix transcriptional regulator [Caproicibacterium argilliputei]